MGCHHSKNVVETSSPAAPASTTKTALTNESTFIPRAVSDIIFKNANDTVDPHLQRCVSTLQIATPSSGAVLASRRRESDARKTSQRAKDRYMCGPSRSVLTIGVDHTLTPTLRTHQCVPATRLLIKMLYHYAACDAEDVCEMHDERSLQNDLHPTYDNIQRALALFVRRMQPSSFNVLYFAGRAGQIHNIASSAQQDDIMNECIYSSDLQPLLDVSMRNTLLVGLPAHSLLLCIFDAGHASPMLDLPFVLNEDGTWMRNVHTLLPSNIQDGAVILCLTLCRSSSSSFVTESTEAQEQQQQQPTSTTTNEMFEHALAKYTYKAAGTLSWALNSLLRDNDDDENNNANHKSFFFRNRRQNKKVTTSRRVVSIVEMMHKLRQRVMSAGYDETVHFSCSTIMSAMLPFPLQPQRHERAGRKRI